MMLEGKCPKCGIRRVGWALRYPRYQTCPNCGIGLEITEDGHLISKGYSPFTAEEYIINQPNEISTTLEEEKDSPRQDKR
jgi:hypothetical protein